MLKQYLGDRPFWASVHRYLVSITRFDNADDDDLRQAVLGRTARTRWFWDQWMYQRIPDFTVPTKYDSTAADSHVVVQQTQQDSSKADSTGLRTPTPAAFRIARDGRVRDRSGRRVARAELSRRQDTIVVRDVKRAPHDVIFDDQREFSSAYLRSADRVLAVQRTVIRLVEPALGDRQLGQRPTIRWAAGAPRQAARAPTTSSRASPRTGVAQFRRLRRFPHCRRR